MLQPLQLEGLLRIYWTLPSFIGNIFDLVVSASLAFSMFFMTVKGEFGTFLAFINSRYAAIVIAVIVFINVILSIWITNAQTQGVEKAWGNLAKSNVILEVYDRMWGSDVAIFDMKKITLKEQAKTNLRPKFMQDAEKIFIKYNSMSIVLNVILNISVFVFTAAKAFIGVFGIGNFILYRGAISRFIEAISSIVQCIARLRDNNQYLLKIFQYFDLPDEMYHGTLAVEKRDDIDYEIEFKNVSFRYPHTDTWVL